MVIRLEKRFGFLNLEELKISTIFKEIIACGWKVSGRGDQTQTFILYLVLSNVCVNYRNVISEFLPQIFSGGVSNGPCAYFCSLRTSLEKCHMRSHVPINACSAPGGSKDHKF